MNLPKILMAPDAGDIGGGGAPAPAAAPAPVLDAAPSTPTTIAAGGSSPAAQPGTAPSINTDPWYKDWLKSDGTVDSKAYERLPDHLKHLSNSLKNHTKIDDVFTKMAHLETLAGKKGLGPLPEGAAPDVVKARNDLMRSINGVPDKPEGYGIAKPADLPDAVWNNDLAAASAKIMHDHNVPPQAVKALVNLQVEMTKKQLSEQSNYETKFFAEQDRKVKESFSRDGTAYDKGVELAARTARTFGIDPEVNPVFKNADVMLAFQKIGVAIGEPKLITGESKGEEGLSNQARAEDIIHNKSNPDNKAYWDGGHPQNKAVKQKVNSMLAEAARGALARQSSGVRR